MEINRHGASCLLNHRWMSCAFIVLFHLAQVNPAPAATSDLETSRLLQQILDNNAPLFAAINSVQFSYETDRHWTDGSKPPEVKRGEIALQDDRFYASVEFTEGTETRVPISATDRCSFNGTTYTIVDAHEQRIMFGQKKFGGPQVNPLHRASQPPFESLFGWMTREGEEFSYRWLRKPQVWNAARYRVDKLEELTETSGPVRRATFLRFNSYTSAPVQLVVDFARNLNDLPIRMEVYLPDLSTAKLRHYSTLEITELKHMQLDGHKLTIPVASLHTSYSDKTEAVRYTELTRILPETIRINETIDTARFQLPIELPGYMVSNTDTLRMMTSRENMQLHMEQMKAKAAPLPTTTPVHGDYTATIRIARSTGKPTTGLPWSVHLASHYGTTTVSQGMLPGTGVVEVAGLAGPENPASYNHILPFYEVRVAGEKLGTFAMYEQNSGGGAVKPLPGGLKHRDLSFLLPPTTGDIAPEAEFIDLTTSRTFTLSSLRGQVVLLDFWGVGCGACQKPLADYHALAAKHSEDWRGRVTILTAATDQESTHTRSHITRKGWQPNQVILHGWCGWPDAPDTRAVVRLYNIQYLPTVCLIDQHGKLLARGSEISTDIEATLQSLLH